MGIARLEQPGSFEERRVVLQDEIEVLVRERAQSAIRYAVSLYFDSFQKLNEQATHNTVIKKYKKRIELSFIAQILSLRLQKVNTDLANQSSEIREAERRLNECMSF